MPPKRDRSRSSRSRNALQRLLHRGKVTQEGLVDILRVLRDLGPDVPAHVSRQALAAANHSRFESIRHVETVLLKNGRTWGWPIAEPNRLLTLMAAESKSFHDLLGEALSRGAPSPEHPWTLIIGYDEFCPGGMFSVGDERKCMNLSYTFLEFGEDNIRSDKVWLTPVIVRHVWFEKVDGGWGSMLRQYLRLDWVSEGGRWG